MTHDPLDEARFQRIKNKPIDADLMTDILAQVIKRERATTDEAVGAIEARLANLDANALLKSAATAIGEANLAALREHAESILLRKSKIVDGEDGAPAIVKVLTE